MRIERPEIDSQRPPDAACAPDDATKPSPPEVGYRQRFTVGFDYPVYFTRDVLRPENPVLASALRRGAEERGAEGHGAEPGPIRFLPVVDAGVLAARPRLAEEIGRYARVHELEVLCDPECVPGGEAAKDGFAVVQGLYARFRALGVDRHAIVVALGGGAVLDAVGYAAATAHRGIRLVRLPTTVLAQNDAGIGVKNGVNALGAKNFVGSFAPPWAVVNDACWLESLPLRERRAGIAEAVKVALIRDPGFFDWIEAHAAELARGEIEALEPLIRRAAELHLDHIRGAGDPFETGSSRPLDFGHWAAHRLESLSRHRLRHGEAVSIGMALDVWYSAELGGLPRIEADRILRLLERLGLPLFCPELMQRDADGHWALLPGIEEFREHLGGRLSIPLLAQIGHAIEAHALDPATILRGLDFLAARQANA